MLDPVERNNAQTVVVSTADIADNQSLALSLNGRTYTATTSNNQASFALPAADLQALSNGLTNLRVVPTGQSSPEAIFPISVEAQTTSSTPHILSITPSFGSLLSPAEAKQSQTVVVTTEGVENDQRIVLLAGDLTLLGSISASRAVFTLTPSQLKGLPVGLDSFTVAVANQAGIQAPTAALSFAVDGEGEAALPHIDQINPSFGSLLEASESARDQTVVVETTGYASGDVLKLSLAGKSFTATIGANGEASFAIPATVLAALLPGVERMIVEATAAAKRSGPALERSFSVDGDYLVPHITGIDPSFGAALDRQEVEQEQTIAVLTSRMSEGQAITLTLNNTTYPATVSRNSARFVLPSADLKLLSPGQEQLTIRATGSGAPDATQAFTVLRPTAGSGGDGTDGSGAPNTAALRGTPRRDELVGSALNDRIAALHQSDRLLGLAGSDRLLGQRGRDHLDGGDGLDILVGGRHGDVLIGGLNQDVFRFHRASDSPAASKHDQDTIGDFFANDMIDLSGFNPSLTFIRSEAFSGVRGELRFAGGQLSADINGDAKADFLVHVNAPLAADQLLL